MKTKEHAAQSSPFNPTKQLLMKLGSIVVHADELISSQGHIFDREAMKPLLADPDVRQWIKDMGVYLPIKR